MEDICQAYQRNDTEYFIGSIITIETERNRRYEVVDGQQRLRRFALLMFRMKIRFSVSVEIYPLFSQKPSSVTKLSNELAKKHSSCVPVTTRKFRLFYSIC